MIPDLLRRNMELAGAKREMGEGAAYGLAVIRRALSFILLLVVTAHVDLN